MGLQVGKLVRIDVGPAIFVVSMGLGAFGLCVYRLSGNQSCLPPSESLQGRTSVQPVITHDIDDDGDDDSAAVTRYVAILPSQISDLLKSASYLDHVDMVELLRQTQTKLAEDTLVETGSFCRDALSWKGARFCPCGELGRWLSTVYDDHLSDWKSVVMDTQVSAQLFEKLQELHSKRWDDLAEMEAAEEEAARIIDEAHGCW